MATKRCNKCGHDKDEEANFYVDSRSKTTPQKRMPTCQDCLKKANRARAAQHPEKAIARSNVWRAKNPGRANEISRAWQLRHPEQFRAQVYKGRYKIDFDAMWKAQEGKCACCGEPMLRGGKDPTSVCADHDRSCCPGGKSCGKCVRGLIHRNCNLVLGYARDSADLLRKAAAYVESRATLFS